MKKFLFAITLLNFSFGFAQCTITGADQLQVGERQIYTATSSDPECADCYRWSYMDQKILLESDTQKNDLTIKGAVPGEALLSLEIKTKNGTVKCDKLIKVIAPTSNILTNDNVKCDIGVTSFKEVRVADNKVSFEPENTDKNLSYSWTVFYRGGTIKKSTDKKPQFDYSDNHVIDKVEMEVFLNRCSTKFSKSYDTNFWYFF